MSTDHPQSTLDEARKRLRRASEEVIGNGHYIMTEGDQWFVSAVASLDRGAGRTQSGVIGLGKRIVAGVDRMRPAWLRRASAKQRVKTLLETEMKRAGLDVDPDEFSNFSMRIATLVELVLSGVVDIRDIGFEQDAETCPLEQTGETP